jgi:hypothetical protein
MRLQAIWKKILRTLPEICPFFLGPLVLRFKYSPTPLVEAASTYAVFLLLFIAWYYVKYFGFGLIALRGKSAKDRSKPEKRRLFGLVLSCIVTMIFLQLLRIRLGYEHFVGALLILGVGGIRISLLKKGLINWSQLVSLCYLTAIGFLTFTLVTDKITWVAIYVSLGLACMVLAYEVVQYAIDNPQVASFHQNGAPRSKGTSIVRPVPFLLIFGPTFIALMVYMRELPSGFLAVFITLLFSSRVITALKDAEKSGTLTTGIERRVASISVLFTVIIAVASHLLF